MNYIEFSSYDGAMAPYTCQIPEWPNGASPFPFLSRALLAMSVLSLLLRRQFSNRYRRSLLKAAPPEQLPDKFRSIQDHHLHPKFSLCLAVGAGANTLPTPAYLQFIFPFRRGSTPPHGPVPDSSHPAGRFTKFSPKAFLSNSLVVVSLLRRSYCLRPRSLMPFLHSVTFLIPVAVNLLRGLQFS
jgi:hypothetical protein